MTRIAAIAIAILLVVLAASAFMLKRAWSQNGQLEVKLANASAIIRQREEDAVANAHAVAQLAAKLRDTETKVITVTERIYAAPVTRACAESPAMRAAVDGVRQLYQPATVPAPDRRGPAAAVPGSANAGKR